MCRNGRGIFSPQWEKRYNVTRRERRGDNIPVLGFICVIEKGPVNGDHVANIAPLASTAAGARQQERKKKATATSASAAIAPDGRAAASIC